MLTPPERACPADGERRGRLAVTWFAPALIACVLAIVAVCAPFGVTNPLLARTFNGPLGPNLSLYDAGFDGSRFVLAVVLPALVVVASLVWALCDRDVGIAVGLGAACAFGPFHADWVVAATEIGRVRRFGDLERYDVGYFAAAALVGLSVIFLAVVTAGAVRRTAGSVSTAWTGLAALGAAIVVLARLWQSSVYHLWDYPVRLQGAEWLRIVAIAVFVAWVCLTRHRLGWAAVFGYALSALGPWVSAVWTSRHGQDLWHIRQIQIVTTAGYAIVAVAAAAALGTPIGALERSAHRLAGAGRRLAPRVWRHIRPYDDEPVDDDALA